jgi:transcriptional regulator with XRE-family HTH domain
MDRYAVDLDQLAVHLRNKMKAEGLSLRGAAKAIVIGAATLSRLLMGSKSENVPDLAVVEKAVKWLGRSLGDFAPATRRSHSTMADVEVHLRALPGLNTRDVEALVGLVKAGYEHAKGLGAKKRS